MHHGASPLDLGATGQFPDDRLAAGDDGELRFAIAIHDGCVILNFGAPVAWLGLSWQQAGELGLLLQAKATELRAALPKGRAMDAAMDAVRAALNESQPPAPAGKE